MAEQLKLKKSKIISRSQRCRPASIKLQEIFIFSTSHRIPPIAILCIFIGAIQQVRQLGRWVDKESNKKWNRKEGVQSKKRCPSLKFFCVLFSVTQSLFLLGFSSSSDNITASNKKSTSKKKSTSVSEISIYYLHKNIIMLLLCQCGLFIHTTRLSNIFNCV